MTRVGDLRNPNLGPKHNYRYIETRLMKWNFISLKKEQTFYTYYYPELTLTILLINLQGIYINDKRLTHFLRVKLKVKMKNILSGFVEDHPKTSMKPSLLSTKKKGGIHEH